MSFSLRLQCLYTLKAWFLASSFRVSARARGVVCVFLSALLGLQVAANAADVPVAASLNPQTPIKSPNDPRDYRYITLPNALRVLLISDPQTEQAAAALQVAVGSAADPEGREGLAHFLEHMLFLGTEKYPEPDSYQAFISKSGGSHNAYTALDHTNYFFDVRPEFLPEALDRFAEFFKSPLFLEAYVSREREAVNAEYLARIRDDGRRANAVLTQVTNPEHPASRFSVGNLNTLADRPGETVRAALLDFYAQQYSANRMALVVLGRESLDALQAQVVKQFAGVANSDRPVLISDAPLFLPDQLPKEVVYKPIKQLRELRMIFPVPASGTYFREKPLTQLANMLGHEGRDSLLSALKREGLAEALWAGESDMGPHGSSFVISVALTEKGRGKRNAVKRWVFAAIDLIRKQGMAPWRFEELKQLAQINFRFQDVRNPTSLVQTLANAMHRYPAEEVLRAPYLYQEFDAGLLALYLKYLTPENVLTLVSDAGGEFTQRAPLYQTPYRITKVKPLKPLPKESLSQLKLPAPNPFIPTRLQVRAVADKGKHPARMIDERSLRLWFKQDETFGLPRSVIRVQLRSPAVANGLAGRVQADLYAAMVLDELNEYSYPAFLAGLGFDIRATARGFDITVAGYNDRQGLLLTEILEALVSPRLEPARFANIRAEIMRRTANGDKQPPYIQLIRQLVPTLYQPAWTSEELVEAMGNTGLADLKRFSRSFVYGSQVDMLAYGNLLPAEARQLATLVGQQLVRGAPQNLTGKLKLLTPTWGGYSRQVDVQHDDHALVMYQQAPDDSDRARAHLLVLAQSIRSPFFNSLRTEQQLGYVVFAGQMPVADYPGLVLVAQSPVADAPSLRVAFDKFIDSLPGWLADDLPAQRAAVMAELQQKPRNLAEQASRYWDDIAAAGPGGKVDFARRERMLKALAEVNAVTLRTFAYQVFDPQRRLLLGTEQLIPEPELVTRVRDVHAFKAEGPYYLVP
ncbi:insulinase family protein [Simiduia sp. 21SJ11W-1]|uniref:insulinase family protein n=1 Tax=Simiduia sp. 21SJ11W-1 TaxID=2909669 RepID=UPI00209D878D|nr:insulinase family protein [Simiduia sp. 21SJ11W-1]UTA46811.1 insulinase family protein [Simiduia sp. 21SJ11W-1]